MRSRGPSAPTVTTRRPPRSCAARSRCGCAAFGETYPELPSHAQRSRRGAGRARQVRRGRAGVPRRARQRTADCTAGSSAGRRCSRSTSATCSPTRTTTPAPTSSTRARSRSARQRSGPRTEGRRGAGLAGRERAGGRATTPTRVAMFERARDIFGRRGPTIRALAMTLNNLGLTLVAPGRAGPGRARLRPRRRHLPARRRRAATRRWCAASPSAARPAVELGRLDDAEHDCADALAIAEQLFTSPHRHIIDARLATATLRLAQGRADEAAALARRCVAEGRVLQRPADAQVGLDASSSRGRSAWSIPTAASSPSSPRRSRTRAPSLQDRPLADRIDAWLATRR